MTDPHEITQQNVHDAFVVAYRRRVGVGRDRIGLSDLQDATGIEARTLRSWRETDTMPHLVNLLKLAALFGPAFVDEILHPVGMGGVQRLDIARSNPIGCMADMTQVAAEISERLRDGVFCHRDKAAVGPMLVELAHLIEEQGEAMARESRQGFAH
jgi:hypothetical protein